MKKKWLHLLFCCCFPPFRMNSGLHSWCACASFKSCKAATLLALTPERSSTVWSAEHSDSAMLFPWRPLFCKGSTIDLWGCKWILQNHLSLDSADCGRSLVDVTRACWVTLTRLLEIQLISAKWARRDLCRSNTVRLPVGTKPYWYDQVCALQ